MQCQICRSCSLKSDVRRQSGTQMAKGDWPAVCALDVRSETCGGAELAIPVLAMPDVAARAGVAGIRAGNVFQRCIWSIRLQGGVTASSNEKDVGKNSSIIRVFCDFSQVAPEALICQNTNTGHWRRFFQRIDSKRHAMTRVNCGQVWSR